MSWAVNRHAVLMWFVIITIFCSGLLVNAQTTGSIPDEMVSLQIKATGLKNSASSGTEVWLAASSDLPLDKEVPAGWEKRGERAVSYKEQPAIWKATVASKHSKIELIKHPWSGIAEITIAGITRTYDLYSEKETVITIYPEEFLKQKNSAKNRQWYIVDMSALLLLFFLTWRFFIRKRAQAVDTAVVQSKNIGYLSRLDHLRFLAASLVVAYHYFHDYVGLHYYTANPLLTFVDEGHTGVALFMVLSGLVFGLIGYRRQISYKGFLFNRIVRIYPLYLFGLFLAHSSHRMDFTNVDTAFFLLPFFNQIKLAMVPLLGQFWTIGVEFQFYLIFPFLNLFIYRYGLRYVLGFLLLSLFFKEFYFIVDSTVRDISYWTILGRIDQFILGMIIAHLYQEQKRRFQSPLLLLGAVILLFAGMQWFNNHGGYGQAPYAHFWVVWPLVEAGLWGFFTLCYISCRWHFPNWYDYALARLGAMSFSIYVMHYFIIPLITRKVGLLYFSDSQNVNIVLTCLILVIPGILFLAGFTYTLIERPFFQFRKKYTVE